MTYFPKMGCCRIASRVAVGLGGVAAACFCLLILTFGRGLGWNVDTAWALAHGLGAVASVVCLVSGCLGRGEVKFRLACAVVLGIASVGLLFRVKDHIVKNHNLAFGILLSPFILVLLSFICDRGGDEGPAEDKENEDGDVGIDTEGSTDDEEPDVEKGASMV